MEDTAILILRGVTYDNLFQYEDFDEEVTPILATAYDKLPAIFSATTPWPRMSNLECINCGCVTARIPCFEPMSCKVVDGVQQFGVGAAACSPFCEVSYAISSSATQSQRDSKLTMIRAKTRVMIGKSLTHIRPALPKTLLAKHGGTLDDFDYQKKLMGLGDYEGLLHAETNPYLTFCD